MTLYTAPPPMATRVKYFALPCCRNAVTPYWLRNRRSISASRMCGTSGHAKRAATALRPASMFSVRRADVDRWKAFSRAPS